MIAIYVRVSTLEQNEAGQREELETWARKNAGPGVEVRWFVDKATGTNLERPQFAELDKLVRRGLVDCVVVWKLDRLSRSLRDGIQILTAWLEGGVRFVSTTQGFDFSGTIGKMIAALLFGVAEIEHETRRERQAAGIAVAKKAGRYEGRKPGTFKSKPARALELREKGLNDAEIGRSLGVSRRTVQRYLRISENSAQK